MARTTGGRLARIYVGYALFALACGAGILLAARPLVTLQSQRLIDAEARGFRTLHARTSPREFGAVIATRAAVDAERGAGYSLRGPNGLTVAGGLPEEAWSAPAEDRWRRFSLPDSQSPRAARHAMVGRVVELDDGSRLLIAYDVDRRVRGSMALVAASIAGIVLAALASAFVAWLTARQTLRQMDAVSRAMTRILAGDLSQRLPAGRATGVDRLAGEFNVALERIERLTTTMRAVADSTAHDLRAPLNRLRAAVEVALRREDDPAELRHALDTVLIEVDRVQNTLEALLRIALAESGMAPFESVDLSSVVADVEELYKPLAEEKGLKFGTRIQPGLELPGNRQLIAQAIANLIDNAIKFTPAGGRVQLAAELLGGAIQVEVVDTGPGIAPGERERAQERSRRLANAAGKPGSGLGLSLVKAVARLHNGRFDLSDNAPGLVARLRFAGSAAMVVDAIDAAGIKAASP